MKVFRAWATLTAALATWSGVVDPAAQAAVPTASASTVAFSASTQALNYVALGDSFSAVGSVSQVMGEWPEIGCLRSPDNVPHQLAALLGANLIDVTCSAARTYDYWQPQNFPVPGEASVGQRTALSTDTELVTISLGGNDGGTYFLEGCLYTWFTGESSCRENWGPMIDFLFAERINPQGYTLEQRLDHILADIKTLAPNAQIVVLAYYNMFRSDMDCAENGKLSVDDREFIEQKFVARLNAMNQRVAQRAGALYVPAPDGLRACGEPGQRDVSFSGIFDDAVPFHPTAVGQRHMAQQIVAALEN